jgi:hypothetical protein
MVFMTGNWESWNDEPISNDPAPNAKGLTGCSLAVFTGDGGVAENPGEAGNVIYGAKAIAYDGDYVELFSVVGWTGDRQRGGALIDEVRSVALARLAHATYSRGQTYDVRDALNIA